MKRPSTIRKLNVELAATSPNVYLMSLNTAVKLIQATEKARNAAVTR